MPRLLTILAFTISLGLGCDDKPKFPLASLPAPTTLESVWDYHSTHGDTGGPYRHIGGVVLPTKAGAKQAWYVHGGHKQVVELGHLDAEVLSRSFEKPNGDTAIMIYTRRGPTTR